MNQTFGRQLFGAIFALIQEILATFEYDLAAAIMLGLLVPAVGVLVMFACTASFLSLKIKTKTFGSPVKDQQDVFYFPHLRGLASILAPVLLVGCGLQLWLWFDNMLSGWEVLTYGQPAALVAAYIQHKIRACMLVEASSQSATLPPSPTLKYASAVRDSGVTIDLEQKPCTPIGDRDCEDELVSVFETMTPKGLLRNCEECFDDK